jgi:hypothetical protein
MINTDMKERLWNNYDILISYAEIHIEKHTWVWHIKALEGEFWNLHKHKLQQTWRLNTGQTSVCDVIRACWGKHSGSHFFNECRIFHIEPMFAGKVFEVWGPKWYSETLCQSVCCISFTMWCVAITVAKMWVQSVGICVKLLCMMLNRLLHSFCKRGLFIVIGSPFFHFECIPSRCLL